MSKLTRNFQLIKSFVTDSGEMAGISSQLAKMSLFFFNITSFSLIKLFFIAMKVTYASSGIKLLMQFPKEV